MQTGQPDSRNTDPAPQRPSPGRVPVIQIVLFVLAMLVLFACSLLQAGVVDWPFSTPAGADLSPSASGSNTSAALGRVVAANPSAARLALAPASATPSPTLVPFTGDPVSARPAPIGTGPASRYFTETGHLVSGDFFNYYQGNSKSSELFGLPLTEAFAERLQDGRVYKVQYFERARMEWHPELPVGQQVQLGLLAPAIVGSRTFPRASAPATSGDTALYFPQTGHTITGGFLTYWRANGGLRIFGLPLSEEVGEDGMTVQYFERARMEYRAELLGTGYAIQLSPVGYLALKNSRSNLPMGTLVRFDPPQLAEGHTTTVEVAASADVTVTGLYDGQSLFFTRDMQRGTAWAMLGAVPFADAVRHTVTLNFENANGGRRTVTRTLEIKPYSFPEESLQFDPTTASLLDPSITQPELTILNDIFSGRTPQKYWDGKFRMPLDGNIRVTSYFATRRCYSCPDGSKPTTYHGGMDMAAAAGTPVRAPAAGKVVFVGRLAVRGNVVIIDHGLGVYSLLAHNSRLTVQIGQTVKQGDTVALAGSSGLSTGSHVHWELHASGPPVEPMEWVNRAMP